jgi:hypothetical protein
MGVDYCRISLKPGIGPDDARLMVERQAVAVVLYGGFFYYYQHEIIGWPDGWIATKPALHEFVDASAELEERLLFHAISRNGETYRDCLRTSPISGSMIFPIEWQIGANRSFLPDELPGRIRQWRGYLAEIERGWHRSYLTLSLAYKDWSFVTDIWDGLAQSAREARFGDDTAAVRPALQPILDQIIALGTPPAIPVPRWKGWADRPKSPLDKVDRERLDAWLGFRTRLGDTLRQWNARVPARHKIPLGRLGRIPEIEVWIAEELAREDRRELLHWLDDCCAQGHGLYYWA